MICVVGATGNTGSALVHVLTAAGVPLRALTRDAAAARARLGPAVEIVQADVLDRASLGRALQGVDKVYAALGGTPALAEAESLLIDAAVAAGVSHFVKLSGVEVEPAVSTIQRIHGAVERHLVASGLPWTVLGGNFFFQNFLGLAPAIRAGVLPLPTGGRRAALVDAWDIGRAAAAVLTTPGHAGRRYRMTGPASLSHSDAAAIFTEVLRRPVSFVDLPPAAFARSGIEGGLPAWLAEQLADVYGTFFGQPGAAAVHDDIRLLTGSAPASLDRFVAANRAAFEADA